AFSSDREDELITTPARREVLREHAFRELTKGTYSPEARKVWSERLERLFEGSVPAVIHCEVAEDLLGRDSSSLLDRNVRAREGEGQGAELVNVWIRQLNELGIDALRQRTPTAPPEEPGPPGATAKPAAGQAADRSGATIRPPEVPVEASVDGSIPSRAESAGEDASTSGPPPEDIARAPEPTERPRAYIGEAPGVYGKPREIWFDPQLPGRS